MIARGLVVFDVAFDDVGRDFLVVFYLVFVAGDPVAFLVVAVFVEGDGEFGFVGVFVIVEEGGADGFVVLVILVADFLHFVAFGVEDNGFVDVVVFAIDEEFAAEDIVFMVVVAELAETALGVVFVKDAAFDLAFFVLDVDLGEDKVGIVEVVGAADDVFVGVEDMLEGDETEVVVFIFCAENHVLLVGEVRLAAALTFLVIYGFEALEDASASGVVGTSVGFVHDGEDVLHLAVETVALAVGELLGQTLVGFLRCIGPALDGLVGAVVDAAAQIIVVLCSQTAGQTQE